MLRDQFRAIDTNGDGILSREELFTEFQKAYGDIKADELCVKYF
jgi:hypothetical protein